jgi:hypothetical protein
VLGAGRHRPVDHKADSGCAIGKLGGRPEQRRLELWQLRYQKENQTESMASLGPRAWYISEAFHSPDVISVKMGSWHLCSYAVLIIPDRVSGNGEREYTPVSPQDYVD